MDKKTKIKKLALCKKKPPNKTTSFPIPHAPEDYDPHLHRIGRILNSDLRRWRTLLDQNYPDITPEQIARANKPAWVLHLQDLGNQGHNTTVQEIQEILQKEDEFRGRMLGHTAKSKLGKSLRNLPERFERMVNSLVKIHMVEDDDRSENRDRALNLRKQLGEEALMSEEFWLAKHFFDTCLEDCERYRQQYAEKGQERYWLKKVIAELHCYLAYLARTRVEQQLEGEDHENILIEAIDHLTTSRLISKGCLWILKPKVLQIKLKKPIAIHGFQVPEDEMYDVVDGALMPIYMTATLLQYDFLILLANQILHAHKVPKEEDVATAQKCAEQALKLAIEVSQPTAIGSALMRFGLVLRECGAFDDALTYFNKLQMHSSMTADYITEAIAYHNKGLCLMGIHQSGDALECFAKQLDMATSFGLKNLEADAMYEIGHILLQEGHTWEGEECYSLSLQQFGSLKQTKGHLLTAWMMLGISAGMKQWGPYATLCRQGKLYPILDWKGGRSPLKCLRKISRYPHLISKTYKGYLKRMEVPVTNIAEIGVGKERIAPFLFPPKESMIMEGLTPEEVTVVEDIISSDDFEEGRIWAKLHPGDDSGYRYYEEDEDYDATTVPKTTEVFSSEDEEDLLPQEKHAGPPPPDQVYFDGEFYDIQSFTLDLKIQSSEDLPGYDRFTVGRVSSTPLVFHSTQSIQALEEEMKEREELRKREEEEERLRIQREAELKGEEEQPGERDEFPGEGQGKGRMMPFRGYPGEDPGEDEGYFYDEDGTLHYYSYWGDTDTAITAQVPQNTMEDEYDEEEGDDLEEEEDIMNTMVEPITPNPSMTEF